MPDCYKIKLRSSGYRLVYQVIDQQTMAEYRVDEHWTLAYNLNSIFDKVYYSTIGPSDRQNWCGEPRNQMLTLRGTFW